MDLLWKISTYIILAVIAIALIAIINVAITQILHNKSGKHTKMKVLITCGSAGFALAVMLLLLIRS